MIGLRSFPSIGSYDVDKDGEDVQRHLGLQDANQAQGSDGGEQKEEAVKPLLRNAFDQPTSQEHSNQDHGGEADVEQ